MQMTAKLFDPTDEELLKKLYEWETDPEISSLIIPVFKEEDQGKKIDFERFRKRHLETGNYISEIFILFADDKPVGNFSLMIDPGHLYKKGIRTAWLGLTIGDREYWGKGVAKMGMELFEKRARFHKALRIELGVFEYNLRAQKFYKKLGYKEIGRIPKFTWNKDKLYDDIRMEKLLQ